MKSLILYGAFDRYNFGDNLMPIVFRKFLVSHYPEICTSHNIINAATSESDLSKYGCLPTIPIRQAVSQSAPGSVVLVVGGETLSSRSITLYSHTIKNRHISRLLREFFKHGGKVSSAFGAWASGVGFEFPLTPSSNVLGKELSVVYASVGGKISTTGWRKREVLNRLCQSTYLSLRDSRNNDVLRDNLIDYRLAPCSVAAAPSLFDERFLKENLSARLQKILTEKYFVFQASPHKIQCSAHDVAKNLSRAAKLTNVPFVLLPIGYASGHDDREFLAEVSKISRFPLLDDLSVWDILGVLRGSSGYFGTSLHGAIVTMGYKKPFFGFGSVSKIDAYFNEWSEGPFLGLRNVDDIPQLAKFALQDHSEVLSKVSEKSSLLALDNLHRIVNSWA